MVSFSEFDPAVSETAAAFQQFHGFDGGLSSIYRCLAQWPTLFNALWEDFGSVM